MQSYPMNGRKGGGKGKEERMLAWNLTNGKGRDLNPKYQHTFGAVDDPTLCLPMALLQRIGNQLYAFEAISISYLEIFILMGLYLNA